MAVGYLKGGDADSEEAAGEPQGLAVELDRRALQGMLKGPVLYLKSRRVQRRTAAAARSK
jgi:hypothetical protein